MAIVKVCQGNRAPQRLRMEDYALVFDRPSGWPWGVGAFRYAPVTYYRRRFGDCHCLTRRFFLGDLT